MVHLSPTAAYIRKDTTPDRHANRSDSAPRRPQPADPTEAALWKLLSTAHTVESLARAMTRDTVPVSEQRIEQVMRKWLDAEVIELATDS